MNTRSVESLWTYIDSLSLSRKNKKWLSDKLLQSAKTDEDEPVMSKDEILSDIRESIREMKLNDEGKLEFKSVKDFINEL